MSSGLVDPIEEEVDHIDQAEVPAVADTAVHIDQEEGHILVVVLDCTWVQASAVVDLLLHFGSGNADRDDLDKTWLACLLCAGSK